MSWQLHHPYEALELHQLRGCTYDPIQQEAVLVRWFSAASYFMGSKLAEIKGSKLDEKQAARVIHLLARYDALWKFLGCDGTAQTASVLSDFKQKQSNNLTEDLEQTIILRWLVEMEKARGFDVRVAKPTVRAGIPRNDVVRGSHRDWNSILEVRRAARVGRIHLDD
jgi:hypothetical protein